MKNEIEIYCSNISDYVRIPGGDTPADVAARLGDALDFRPICALVNNKTENLDFPIYSPKQVEFLDRRSRPGLDVYIRSLCMMVYKSVRECFPGLTLRIELSISGGHFCRLYDAEGRVVEVDADMAAVIKSRVGMIYAADIPFERKERLTKDVIEVFHRQGLHDKVQLLESINELYTTYYLLDGLADSYYGPLAPSTGHIGIFDVVAANGGFLLLGPDPVRDGEVMRPVRQPKLYKSFTDYLAFNRVIRVSNVGELNRAIEERETASLINVAEAMHDKLLGRISDDIARRREKGEAGIVLLAGPSSSGKTTTCKRLAIQLMTNCIVPKMISLDDYFVDREHTPLDENGDYDYEHLHALDLERFNSDLRQLLEGKEINLPTYSFEYGRRIEKKRPLRLDSNDVLLIEGIHGLNPELTASIPQRDIYKVYVSALTTLRIDDHNWISTSDNRLLRRIVRDYKYRHTSALETIRRWPSVRRGEERWIFPFQENADAMFNSSLIFEIGVMKEYAEPLLRDVPHSEKEYAQAYRLLRFLRYFEPIPAEQVPTTSLLREFLGGSSFKY
ncbi:MAG: nucleoside kinase [Muribaculaceae bacterium]|nr:nucleoside kinase [Muribaculaceae bacterium]